MSEEMLVRHCSPTLAGLKTGNMFNCAFSCRLTLFEQIRQFNRRFKGKGLRILPLRVGEKNALIYVYRPLKLREDLSSDIAASLLKRFGYGGLGPEQCIVTLIGKLSAEADFPHEIGLFLGYPAEDVQGFIDNKAQSPKCVGCWKVYSDVERAQSLFAKYKKCTDSYMHQLTKGNTIERLVV